MKQLFAIFFIIGLSAAPVHAANEETKGSSQPGVFTKSFTEEGEEKEFSIGSSYRSQFIYPSNYGSPGIFRTRAAESLPEGTITFGIGGEFYSVMNAPVGPNANAISESLFLGYSPNSRLTFAVTRRNTSTTYGTPSLLVSSLGDFNFTTLFTFPILGKTLSIAPVVDILVASDFNNLAPGVTMLSAGAGVLATFSLYPTIGIPLMAHANLIYHMPQMRNSAQFLTGAVLPETFYHLSRYPTLTSRLGAEFQIGDFIPFVEFSHSQQVGSVIAWADSPSAATFGARITPLNNKSAAVLIGADVGIGKGVIAGTPFNPDWQVIAQLSYTTAVTGLDRKHYATTADVKVVNRKFVISKNINFKVGSAELEEESKHVLDQIAQVILENKVNRLHIVGHTDSSHTDEFNVKLSLDRANTVRTYLSHRGVAEDGLTTQGFGKRKPKASNVSESGRALNRRVEFFILD